MPSEVGVSTLAGLLPDAEYLRERFDPRPGDRLYLHLSDLAHALSRYRTNRRLKILDFGCGGSPYRSLFANCTYLRADLPGVSSVDYQIDADGRVNAPSDQFDMVLSTQVLEHCPDPKVYLSEARRVLKTGGKLLLSTHGVFEEHGCPFDFLRWTSFGLERSITNAGFEVRNCLKLTTAGRAVAFLLNYHSLRSHESRKTIPGFLFAVMQRIMFARGGLLFHRMCDISFKDCRVVDRRSAGHSIYIALLVEAVKTPEWDSLPREETV